VAITATDTLLAITGIIEGATTTTGTTGMDPITGTHTVTNIPIGPITGVTVTGGDTIASVTVTRKTG
jgi:hypothetical protein